MQEVDAMTNEQFQEALRTAKKEVLTDLMDAILDQGMQTIEEVLEEIKARKKELSQPSKQN